MNKSRVKLINGNPFYTDRVQIVFELLLPDTVHFDQALYAKTWLQSYSLFQKSLITLQELIQIGSKIQTRQLPRGQSLGAFTYKPFFNLLEYSSEVIYEHSEDHSSVDWEIVAEKIAHYAVELSNFKA